MDSKDEVRFDTRCQGGWDTSRAEARAFAFAPHNLILCDFNLSTLHYNQGKVFAPALYIDEVTTKQCVQTRKILVQGIPGYADELNPTALADLTLSWEKQCLAIQIYAKQDIRKVLSG